jgi:hypothetical protein
VGEWGYVAAGYTVTAGGLAGYVIALFRRAHRARRRSAALAEPPED